MTTFPLFQKLPQFHELSNELVLDRFLEYAQSKGLELYPAQEEAILALIEGKNVILNTPTGSGKSLVAMALHFHSLAMGKRSIYTCPIKALVNEKFLALCKEFGPDQVGMVTGDGSVNREAPILCCTAEILANIALHEGENAPVDDIIMDEFHYYSDRERGVAWQVPLLTLSRARFLLMSATLGEMEFFEKKLGELTGRDTEVISRGERPVPLTYEYRETPLHETVSELIAGNKAPVYLVNFTQREAAEEAQNLMSIDFCTKEQKRAIAEELHGMDFSSPYGKEIQKFLKHGVGLHHAGLLPKYRVLVERLAQTGLLKVISGTDTLGVGVNIPIRTVLFTKLCKYDGEKTAILSNRDFHQIAGRAGRKGYDNEGSVVAQAPAHVIENLKLELKAKSDPKKAKKIVKAKPPEKGFVHWDENTFKKLVSGRPEQLQSRFQVSHGMLLNVLARENEDGCMAMRGLIRSSHEPEAAKRKHRSRAYTLFRSLLDRKIVELIPNTKRGEKRVRVNVELQDEFSLNQTLALWLIDTIALLDRESETYALDLLTLVEAILESPDLILRKQLDRVRNELYRELKEAGVEYDERQEELEKAEHPKPLRDFIYSTFNDFSDKHPWVGNENIRPKSIAREMYETYQSFAEYVREYELQRAEGLLLRYITDVYRALAQTVPEAVRTDEVDAIIAYFGSIVRGVDSSLLDEWERLKNPEREVAPKSGASALDLVPGGARPVDLFTNEKALRVKLMNELYRFVRLIAIRDFEGAQALLQEWGPGAGITSDGGSAAGVGAGSGAVVWTTAQIEAQARAHYDSGHTAVRTDPGARKAQYTRIEKGEADWTIEQTLVDPEENNDWQIVMKLDVRASREADRPVLTLEAIEPIGGF
jgi:superfamily II RNA helicase